ncbi:MAG: hypothetical protein KC516_03325 [Nanoarchaeota archaeon]|nr:hypothetical protein [Nanoarchaeota archaeon]
MAIGVTFIILAVVVVAIWLIIEAKRMKHKIFAIFLIVLVVFSYVSFSVVMKKNEVDLKTVDGWKDASILYFSWLGHVFSNLKSVTVYAINQDWKSANETLSDAEKNKSSLFKKTKS